MAITKSRSNPVGVAAYVTGKFSDDAGSPADVVLSLGFTPRYFAWINFTQRITWEKIDGMSATQTLKTVAAGTRTLDTGSVIVLDDGDGDQDGAGSGTATSIPGTKPSGDVTIDSTALAQNDVCFWIAIG